MISNKKEGVFLNILFSTLSILLCLTGCSAKADVSPSPSDIQALIDQGQDESEGPLTVCAQQAIAVKGAAHAMLALCHAAPTGDAAKTVSVSTPGHVDLFVLRREGNQWVTAAMQQNVEAGSLGAANDVKVLRLGDDFHGFSVRNVFVGQGHTIGGMDIYAPKGDGFAAVLQMTLDASFSGDDRCGKDESGCRPSHDIRRRLEIDDHQPLAVYPIHVTETSTEPGHTSTKRFDLNFSRSAWAYKAPKDVSLQVE